MAILNIQDVLSIFGGLIPVKKMTAAQTAFHLSHDVLLKGRKLEIILFDEGPGLVGERISWITGAENIFRRTSAPYRPQSTRLVDSADQTIQATLVKML